MTHFLCFFVESRDVGGSIDKYNINKSLSYIETVRVFWDDFGKRSEYSGTDRIPIVASHC